MELKAFEYELPVHLIFGAGKAECIGKEVKNYGKKGVDRNRTWEYKAFRITGSCRKIAGGRRPGAFGCLTRWNQIRLHLRQKRSTDCT